MIDSFLALGQQTGGGVASSLVMMLLIVAVFYFLIIRPQQKRTKEHAAMLASLKKGEQVITRGGLIGRVFTVQDPIVTLEVQEKVRVRIHRSYIDNRFQELVKSAEKATEPFKPEPASSEPKA